MWDVLSGVAKMAWDVISGVTKTAWDVMSGVTKRAWDVLSGVANLYPRGKFWPAHSFPGEKVGRPILSPPSQFPPPNNFKNHNGIIISLHKFKKPLLN